MQHKELSKLINKLSKFSYNKVPEALISYFVVALKSSIFIMMDAKTQIVYIPSATIISECIRHHFISIYCCQILTN